MVDTLNYYDIGQRIRKYRKACNMSQDELAEKVGISNVSLSNYERGTQMPDLITLAKIAVELDVSTDVLLGIQEEITENEMPRTDEARILANGIDKLPKEQREQALSVIRAMFAKYEDYFEKENTDET